MPTIAVVTDSTACLTEDLLAGNHIRVVPIHVIVEGRTYLDGVDISSDEVSAALTGHKSVTTSRPTTEQFFEAYTEAAASGSGCDRECASVICAEWHLRRGTAGRPDAPVPVEVVDSRTIAMGLGFSALNAARAANSAADLPEVCEAARSTAADSQVLFYVDTLEFLRRGGRIGKASALLAAPCA